MPEISRILDQFDRAFNGDAWHGDPLMQLLGDVTADAATQRPLAGAHTIWEIVLHIAHWEDVVRRRVGGQALDGMEPEHNWPTVPDTSDAAWVAALDRLRDGHQRLRAEIAGFPGAQLGETVAGQRYSYYVMFHGVIQHTLYHAGQIAILKKAR